MYANDSFPKPKKNQPIWRYMDFARFYSLIVERSLFFASLARLHNADPYEGTFPQELAQLYAGNGSDEIYHMVGVSSWHMSTTENAGFWRLYSQPEQGIAVKSTFKRLADSFVETGRDIHIMQIRYINYKVDNFDQQDQSMRPLNAAAYKRSIFKTEQELRAATLLLESSNLQPRDTYAVFDEGVPVPVNLDTLIQSVYVSPYAGNWFRRIVERLLTDNDLSVPVRGSRVLSAPYH